MRVDSLGAVCIPANTSDPRLLYHAGMICFLSGQYGTARQLLLRALGDPFCLSDPELLQLQDVLAFTASSDSWDRAHVWRRILRSLQICPLTILRRNRERVAPWAHPTQNNRTILS